MMHQDHVGACKIQHVDVGLNWFAGANVRRIAVFQSEAGQGRELNGYSLMLGVVWKQRVSIWSDTARGRRWHETYSRES